MALEHNLTSIAAFFEEAQLRGVWDANATTLALQEESRGGQASPSPSSST